MAKEIFSSEHAVSSPGPDRTDAIFSQTRATCEPRRQARSCSSQGDEVGEGVGSGGRRRWSCCRMFEGRVGESSECGEAATSPAGGGRVPQVHHSVREAHLRAGRRTISKDEGTRRGERTFGAVEAEQAEVPKVVSSVQEAVPPVDWAAEVQRLREELREGRSPILVAQSCQSSSEAAVCCRRGLQNVVQELSSQYPQSTRCGTVVIRKHLELRDAIEFGDKESDSDGDGSDAARCSAVPQFAFHSEQHGCVRIMAHHVVGWVVGWEKQPIQVPPADGAACGRCHGLGTATPNQMMRVGTSVCSLESHVDSDEEPLLPPSSPPEEVIRAHEADLCSPPRASRRVVLVPQSQGGMPASIQDARETLPSKTLDEADVPSTFPASSGAVRRLVLDNSPMAQGDVAPVQEGVHQVGDWFGGHRNASNLYKTGCRLQTLWPAPQ